MPWLQRPTYHWDKPEEAPCRGYRDPLITGRNPRTRHAVVTETHLSRGEIRGRTVPWLQGPTYHGEQPEDGPCRGYSDPLITGRSPRTRHIVVTGTHLSRGIVFIKERTHFWLSRGQMYRDLQGVALFRCRGEACQCSDRKYFYVMLSMYETRTARGPSIQLSILFCTCAGVDATRFQCHSPGHRTANLFVSV
jgi:hypothetical protein